MAARGGIPGIEGRNIWVVGAGGGGIGTAVCAELAAAGAVVVGVDRDEPALESTRVAIAESGGEGHLCIVDATNRAAMEAFAAAERARARLPFGLVNIVGGLERDQFGPILETDDATFDAILLRNLRASWLSSQLFARAVIENARKPRANPSNGGSIVQLASIVALEGMPFGAAYAAAKAALLSLARTQALEWGAHAIRVNAIAAGTIHTPRSSSQDADRDRRTIPLGRRGATQDIARAALFFLSDLAAWVTGQTLAVDGGASIKPSYLGDDGLPVFVQDAALRERLVGEDPS